jgi:hypothetical protein
MAQNVRARPKLVAFTGPAGSGKSTAASGLVYRHGFMPVRFADPLKAMAAALYDQLGLAASEVRERVRGSLKDTPDPALEGITPRFIMQTLGTEWGRQTLRDSLWVDIWRARAERELRMGHSVVVDDCRFQNEADVVRELGGIVVGVFRPGGARAPEHASENGVMPDTLIANTKTEAVLDAKVAAAVLHGGHAEY